MKKIINSYRIFAPDLYTVLGTLVGSMLLCLLAAFMYHVTLPEFTVITIPTMLIMLDVMGDFFVFQGIFSKNFDFGLLTTSLKGFSVLKMAVIGDQLRRLIQITAVMITNGIIIKPAMFEKQFFSDNISYAGFLVVLILTIYCANTLVLNITRRFSNYAEGILPMTICSLVEGIAIFGVDSLFLKEGYSDPTPLIIVMTVLSIAATFIMCERVKLRFMDSFGERTPGRFGDDALRKMIIFLLTTFGSSFIMIPVMKIGFDTGADLSAIMVAQMMYPACGVVLAKLLSYNEGKLPKAAYVTILLTGMITLVIAGISVINPVTVETNGMTVSVYYSISSAVVIVASILSIIMILASGRKKRENAGLKFPNAGKSLLFVLLFAALYFACVFVNTMLLALINNTEPSEALHMFLSIFALEKDLSIPAAIMSKLLKTWFPLLINLPLSFLIFLGEEYGWRYFLQPRMQKKYGITLGVILLGFIWGIWHTGADLMFYSTETGLQMIIVQIIACIALSIFMGYAYMKTENIWVPVMIHYFNNNIVGVLSGGNPIDAMTGKVVGWEMIPVYIIGYSVFWAFIFTPTMRGKIAKKNISPERYTETVSSETVSSNAPS